MALGVKTFHDLCEIRLRDGGRMKDLDEDVLVSLLVPLGQDTRHLGK